MVELDPPATIAAGETWTYKIEFTVPSQQAGEWKIGTRHISYITIGYDDNTSILESSALLAEAS